MRLPTLYVPSIVPVFSRTCHRLFSSMSFPFCVILGGSDGGNGGGWSFPQALVFAHANLGACVVNYDENGPDFMPYTVVSSNS